MQQTRWTTWAGLALLGGSLLAGCQTDESARAGQPALQAGNYPQAYQQAVVVANNPAEPRRNREQAAFTAGQAAFRKKDYLTAQQYLQVAAASSDPALSGASLATLGLVYDERGLHRLAADALLRAADKLQAQDKANAYFYAGVAQQKDGRWPTARTTLSLAMSHSRDQAFRQKVQDQLRITGYTLQTGAFSREDYAQSHARTIADKAVQNRLGNPRVVPAVDPDGRKLYLVHVGQYSSWPTALMARDRLGQTRAIVTPLVSGGR